MWLCKRLNGWDRTDNSDTLIRSSRAILKAVVSPLKNLLSMKYLEQIVADFQWSCFNYLINLKVSVNRISNTIAKYK